MPNLKAFNFTTTLKISLSPTLFCPQCLFLQEQISEIQKIHRWIRGYQGKENRKTNGSNFSPLLTRKLNLVAFTWLPWIAATGNPWQEAKSWEAQSVWNNASVVGLKYLWDVFQQGVCIVHLTFYLATLSLILSGFLTRCWTLPKYSWTLV